MQQEVKFCIVCDSALGATTFVGLAMQLIQPMIMRLQEKHAGCKLTVGMITYTTPTTRPTIVVQRAFCQATALFPLFKGAPHLLGIGTTGLGGPNGMAMLEGLVAAVEMCDDVLESPARRLRTRHPSVAQQPTRLPPIFHVLLIGSSKIDPARRPLYNQSSALDDISWETLSDELSKRNINLSLCVSTPTKDAKDQPILALHSKLWPSPDPIWFQKPKGYMILLSGTHMPGAANLNSSKRPPEQAASTGTPKRAKIESPKPPARPAPGRIDIPAPAFPPTQVAPQPPSLATAPTTAPPQPPVSVPPPTIPPVAPQPQTSPPPPPPPAQPPNLPPSQSPPPPMAQPNVPPAGQINSQILHVYRQIHLALRTPTTPEASRHKLLSSGFRIDPSGQLIGGAGVVFDARGEPGVGATVSPKVHAMAFERARAAAAQAGIVGAGVGGVGGVNPANAAFAQQALAVQMMRQQMLQQKGGQAQVGIAGQGQAGPSQPQVQAQLGQLPLSSQQFVPPVAQNSPPKNNPSPSLVNRSPSHTHTQPPNQQIPGSLPGTLPPQAPPPTAAGTPKQSNMGTPQHVGMTPQNMGTPQAHVAHTPQAHVASTPQQAVSTPQQPQSHGTPQHVTGTPQLVHATPQAPSMQQSPPQGPNMSMQQNQNTGVSQNPNFNGLQNTNPMMSQNPNSMPPNPNLPSQNAGGQQMWNGQIVYLLRQRDDQAPAQLHFHAIAAGGPGHNIDTNKWPPRLLTTSGFKALPRNMAGQLYASALPFGQIIIDPAHSATDQQKHAVFHKVITAGYSIFYEFPHDPTNPLPPNAPPGSARGLLFFSTPNAPTRILFKVFINQLCPPVLCRGGQPAGPGLMGNNANGTGAASVANGGGAGSTPVAVPGVGMGLPVAGLGGLPNGMNNMLGNQSRNPVPGSGLQGIVPGAGMIPGAGRPNPTPTPPAANINGNPNHGMGINPAMMQGLNGGGIPGLGPAAMPGLASTGVPGLGGAGLGLGNIPGLAQGNVPGMNPGNVPRPNPTGLNIAQNPQHTAIFHMALARLGFTPAQYASATAQEKGQVMQQVQRLMMQVNQQQQQRQQAAAVANGMGMAGMANRPALAPGQPGFEQLQAYMRQQQQRQGGQ